MPQEDSQLLLSPGISEVEKGAPNGVATLDSGGKVPSGQLSAIFDLIYPVGSVYISANDVSPATLFGGTWEQIQDRFLVSAGTTYTASGTGGAASVKYVPSGSVGSHTLIEAELPSHSHGLNSHTHSIGAHSHGLNSHTHTIGSHSHGLNSHKHSIGAHSHGLNSHTHGAGSFSASSGGGHHHEVAIDTGSGVQFPAAALQIKSGCWSNSSSAMKRNSGSTSDVSGHTHSVTGTSGQASGSTANSTAFDSGPATGSTAASTVYASGEALGSTANSVAFDSGAADGRTSTTGSGTGHDHGFTGSEATIATVPPYLAVYMWKRTA